MKTIVKKEGDTVIVHFEGRIDYSGQDSFRDHLQSILPIESLKNSPSSTHIIFDLENLSFVGSSGISSFIRTLQEFNSHSPIKPRYRHVRSEFRKMIRAFAENGQFEFIEDNSFPGHSSSLDH